MRKIVSSVILVSALAVSSAIAADLPSKKSAPTPPVFSGIDAFGSVAAGYNWGNFSAPGSSLDANGMNLAGRATFSAPVSGLIGFQADGTLDRNVNKLPGAMLGGDKDTNLIRTTGDLAAHVYLRNSTGLIGVIGQASASELNIGFLSDRRYFAGLEGQYFIGNTTLYAQAAYQNANFGFTTGMFGGGSSSLGLSADGVTVLGQVRHFLTPNAMIALKGGYEVVETTTDLGGGSLRHSAWMVGAKGEYRFDKSPVSAFVDVDYRKGEFNTGGSKESETRGMLGLKYSFGSTTLIERDRNGASLDPIRSLKAILPIGGLAQ